MHKSHNCICPDGLLVNPLYANISALVVLECEIFEFIKNQQTEHQKLRFTLSRIFNFILIIES